MRFQMSALKSSSFMATGAALWIGSAVAAPLPLSYPSNSGALFESVMRGQAPTKEIDINADRALDLQRQVVNYPTKFAAGTVIIDTSQTYLYYVLGEGKAIRYGIGVGREGFTWSGVQAVTRMAEWPDWTPPHEMIARQPGLPRWMAGGESNPLGARAIYLGKTIDRIHGTNMPATIGQNVSSGCIRMLNADVIDLYGRVQVGTKIVVLPPITTRLQRSLPPLPPPESRPHPNGTGDAMPSAYLRLQADRCQRLSRSCMDLRVARDLRLMADEYYAEASRIEEKILSPEPH